MTDNNHDEQNEYYSKRAPEYEQIYFRDNPERRKEIDDESARLKSIATDKSVIELACGTGYWTTRISETAKEIVSTDLSLEMINEAQKKKYNCPTKFMQADLHKPPFEKASCDLLVLGFWFSHEPIQNYPEFFRTLMQLVNEDGKIWMIDNNPPAEGSFYESTGKDEYGNNYKQRFLDDKTEYSILKNYFTENELKKIFEPYFEIESLIHMKYYWSVVLRAK